MSELRELLARVKAADARLDGPHASTEESAEAVAEYHRSALDLQKAAVNNLPALLDRIEELADALEQAEAFIAIMFGRGPNCDIPETVRTPLGVNIKAGEIMTDVRAALRSRQSMGERG